MEKTHYRKAFNSPYLSSADIVEPTVFTTLKVVLEKDKTKKTTDLFNTVYWVEKEIRNGEELKPMILNATNSRAMKELTGSPYIDDWGGVVVTVYVDSNVRFGRDTVEGLRISTEKPRMVRKEVLPNTIEWRRAVERYKKDGNLHAVLKHVDISEDNQQRIVAEASRC